MDYIILKPTYNAFLWARYMREISELKLKSVVFKLQGYFHRGRSRFHGHFCFQTQGQGFGQICLKKKKKKVNWPLVSALNKITFKFIILETSSLSFWDESFIQNRFVSQR